MKPFQAFESHVAPLLRDDVDTDQIIPARFLKVTERRGLGRQLFADWRTRKDGSDDPEFVLNRPETRTAKILFVGSNFGCGSSREHAPWALTDHGFRAVVARGFADIFSHNALENGLLPIRLDDEDHAALERRIADDPATELRVELDPPTVRTTDGFCAEFPIDDFARHRLREGMDSLDYLLTFTPEVDRHEQH